MYSSLDLLAFLKRMIWAFVKCSPIRVFSHGATNQVHQVLYYLSFVEHIIISRLEKARTFFHLPRFLNFRWLLKKTDENFNVISQNLQPKALAW